MGGDDVDRLQYCINFYNFSGITPPASKEPGQVFFPIHQLILWAQNLIFIIRMLSYKSEMFFTIARNK
jgi:hypothetical protein